MKYHVVKHIKGDEVEDHAVFLDFENKSDIAYGVELLVQALLDRGVITPGDLSATISERKEA